MNPISEQVRRAGVLMEVASEDVSNLLAQCLPDRGCLVAEA